MAMRENMLRVWVLGLCVVVLGRRWRLECVAELATCAFAVLVEVLYVDEIKTMSEWAQTMSMRSESECVLKVSVGKTGCVRVDV